MHQGEVITSLKWGRGVVFRSFSQFFPKFAIVPPLLITIKYGIFLLYPVGKFDKTYWHLGLTNIEYEFFDKSFYSTNSFLASKKAQLLYTKINSREKYSYLKFFCITT